MNVRCEQNVGRIDNPSNRESDGLPIRLTTHHSSAGRRMPLYRSLIRSCVGAAVLLVVTATLANQEIEPQRDTDQATALDSGAGSESPDHDFSRRDALIASLTIFVLAIFVGFEIITKVPPTLHTPLMSGSNAISGITIVGALLVAGSGLGASYWLALIAVVMATTNAVGGFLVTHRMLAMFKKR